MFGSALYSATARLAPSVAASLQVTPVVAVGLEISLAAELLERDHAAAIVLLPEAWLGVVVAMPRS
jgi:hypothetical protein